VSVRSDSLFLGPDFEIGPGRSSTSIACRGQILSSSDVAGEMFVDLGRLACKGSQRYPALAGLDRSNNQSLVIWCEQFSVLIQPADLLRKTS
jgi:hypothetical protein